jgi:hypothetical protein
MSFLYGLVREWRWRKTLGCITVMADFTWVGYVMVDLLRERPLLREFETPLLEI